MRKKAKKGHYLVTLYWTDTSALKSVEMYGSFTQPKWEVKLNEIIQEIGQAEDALQSVVQRLLYRNLDETRNSI